MADKNILGKFEILKLWDGTAYLPIGCLTSNNLSKTVETQEGVVTKCESDPEPTYGKRGYEVAFDAVAVEDNVTKASYDKASTIMDNSFENNVQTFWEIETTLSGGTSTSIYGKGVFASLERQAPADGVVTFSGTITGSGKVSTTDLVGV